MATGYWSNTLHKRLSRRRALGGGAAIGAAALAASLVACGDSGGDGDGEAGSGLVSKPVDSTKQATKGGVMQSHFTTEQPHFDPLTGASAIYAQTVHAYSRLLRFKVGTVEEPPDGAVEGDVANAWEVSQDGLQVTLKLRPNMKFDPRAPTNGRAITAQDVKWSWDRFAALSPSRGNLVNSVVPEAPVESLSAPDASTIVVKLAFPQAGILKYLAWNWLLSIVPTEADGQFDSRQEMRGSGPWMMTKYERSIGWEYRRNPNWFRANELPYLDGIDYALISEGAQQLAQFKAKRLWTVSPNADLVLQTKRESPEVVMLANSPFIGNTGGGGMYGFSKRSTSPFQRDIRVRHAVSHLLDRDAWLDAINNVSGLGREGLPVEVGWNSHCACSWPTVWLDPKEGKLGEGSKYFQYNPDEAAKLLRAAGHFGLEQELVMRADGSSVYNREQAIFADMLNTGGHFKIKTRVEDYNTFVLPKYIFVKPGGDFEGISPLPWGAFPDFDGVLWGHWAPGSRNDWTGDWDNIPGLRDLMVRHRQERDEKKQIAIAHEWQREMAKQMPLVPNPGRASTFTLYWPWMGNAGVHQTWLTNGNASETFLYYWLDKSKDTRTA
jgi:peptide/nickel transport system substrate-binding protein